MTLDNPLHRILGGLSIFASAFCFYFATVVMRWSEASASIDPAYFSFARFLLGFITVCAMMAYARQPPRPYKYHLLVGRALSNCLAVYCFYVAVNRSSVAEANILNMTYPVFVALLSWIILRHQRDPAAAVIVAVAFVGIWFILAPEEIKFKTGNLWGLASGVSASGAILYLNISRQHHDVNTILFFMFGIGALVMFALFRGRFFWPDRVSFFYLTACAVIGIVGQFLITVGFRYITAVEGSIISSMRIFLAAMLGPFLVGEAPLALKGWIGALILFSANAVLAFRLLHPERRYDAGAASSPRRTP